MLELAGCDHQRYALLDYAHVFHLGYGLDVASSTIVLLAKLDHFGKARSLDSRLAAAFARYDKWCHENGKVTSIDEFSCRGFGMQKQFLGDSPKYLDVSTKSKW